MQNQNWWWLEEDFTFWEQSRKAIIPNPPVVNKIVWHGTTNRIISW